MEQEDLERLLEKRWKRYRARQRRRKLTSSVTLGAIRVADAGARLLRKVHLLKQARREKVAVE